MRTPFTRATGNRLKFARDEAGLTTADLAERLGATEITVRKHLRGDVSLSHEQVAHYAAVLQVGIEQLSPEWAPSDSNRQPTGSELAA